MTAILTKQNAADKALVGGGDGMSNGGNGLLSNLHVFNGATFDGKTEFSNVDGASVTFNSTPVFENDIIVNVNQEPYKDGNPYTLTSILDVQDQLWTDKKILYKNVEIVDNTINACIDKWCELANTIDTHLTTNPDITETVTPNKSSTLMTENLPVLLNEPEEDEPVVDDPTVTINPNKINDTYDTVITAVSDTLTHFENNDLTLYNMTTDNSTKIDTINNAIKNINFDLGEKNKDIVEIFETLDQLQSDIDTNKINISTKASITELTNNYATNEKVDNLQLSLKALIDQIHTLDKSQESHLDANSNTETPNTYSMRRARVATEVDDINDEKVNDVMVDWITTMNDSFNHFEENDKALKNNLESSISTINNKFDNYTTTADLLNNYTLKTDSYAKTESDSKYETIANSITNDKLLTIFSQCIHGYYLIYSNNYLSAASYYIERIAFGTNSNGVGFIETHITDLAFRNRYLILHIGSQVISNSGQYNNILFLFDIINITSSIGVIYGIDSNKQSFFEQLGWFRFNTSKSITASYSDIRHNILTYNAPITELHNNGWKIFYFNQLDKNLKPISYFLGMLMESFISENMYEYDHIKK